MQTACILFSFNLEKNDSLIGLGLWRFLSMLEQHVSFHNSDVNVSFNIHKVRRKAFCVWTMWKFTVGCFVHFFSINAKLSIQKDDKSKWTQNTTHLFAVGSLCKVTISFQSRGHSCADHLHPCTEVKCPGAIKFCVFGCSRPFWTFQSDRIANCLIEPEGQPELENVFTLLCSGTHNTKLFTASIVTPAVEWDKPRLDQSYSIPSFLSVNFSRAFFSIGVTNLEESFEEHWREEGWHNSRFYFAPTCFVVCPLFVGVFGSIYKQFWSSSDGKTFFLCFCSFAVAIAVGEPRYCSRQIRVGFWQWQEWFIKRKGSNLFCQVFYFLRSNICFINFVIKNHLVSHVLTRQKVLSVESDADLHNWELHNCDFAQLF